MNRVVILIPCSGSKRRGGTICYDTNMSILHYLTNSSKQHLLDLRGKLFGHFSIPFGEDIGYQQRKHTIEYMEAYKRYTGQIYGQISSSSWGKLKSVPNLDLVIVSALYGLLRYDEPIRYYDKTMKNKVGHQTLKMWWRNSGLCAILKDYINVNNITTMHNVLSNDYNEVLVGCSTDMKVEYSYHDFSKYKSGSNVHRGKWVDEFIQNF